MGVLACIKWAVSAIWLLLIGSVGVWITAGFFKYLRDEKKEASKKEAEKAVVEWPVN